MWPFCSVNISIILYLFENFLFNEKMLSMVGFRFDHNRRFLEFTNMQKIMTQFDLSESSLFLFSVQERDWPGFYLMISPLKLIFSEGADPNILGFFFLESYDLREAISTVFVCDHKSLLCA